MVSEPPPGVPSPDSGAGSRPGPPDERFRHFLAASAETSRAVADLTEQLRTFAQPDLLMLFVSAHHAEEMAQIGADVRRAVDPRVLLGVSTETVVAGSQELERTPAIAALAARLPGARLRPFRSDDLRHSPTQGEVGRLALRELLDTDPNTQASIIFADPYSTPVNRLIPQLNESRAMDRDGRPAGTIIGGLASGGSKAGENALLCDDKVMRSGFVGVTLAGRIRIDAAVSQGCRPIAENMVITKAKNNLIFELGGRPVVDVFRETFESLESHERELLENGLFLGRVVSEYKDPSGRGDYLIRNVAGMSPDGYLAVHDLVRVGQTVRFHARDAQTAEQDLELMLTPHQFDGPPDGVLLVTCTGRGRNLFDHNHHDAAAIQRAFAAELPGHELAKGGTPLDAGDGSTVPLAGFFGAGEIGPVGEQSYLHGHSACAVMFRH